MLSNAEGDCPRRPDGIAIGRPSPKRMPIVFCDLRRALAPIRADVDAAVRRVADSGWFLRGKEVAAFEEEWAAYCGQAHCVTCNSGTDALTLAAIAMGRKRVEVQANTLPLTAVGLSRAGATIAVREIGGDGRLAEVTPQAVPVLLYGRAPSAAEAAATLFDAAHAHGWKPPRAAVACWSFYPTKTLGALGDAGAVTTNDAGLASAMRELSGRDDRFYDSRQITSRMDEVQAAVLRVKLRHLDAWIEDRRRIAARYRAGLPGGVAVVTSSPEDLQHLFVIRSDRRDGLAAWLDAAGIATKVHFPVPLHRQTAAWQDGGASFPVAESWCDTVLSLPCYPGFTDAEIDRICDEIGRFATAA
jgi:dTDP-3-amino-3,4,6-trideoxy-alpha-D-glucose transaminase